MKLRVIKYEYECAREIISFNRHRSFSQPANDTKTLTHNAKMMKTKPNKFIITLRWFCMIHSHICALITTLITTLCVSVSVLCLSMNLNQLNVSDCLKPNKWENSYFSLTLQFYNCQKTFFSSQSKQIFFKMFSIINCRITILIARKRRFFFVTDNQLLLNCCHLFLNTDNSDHF